MTPAPAEAVAIDRRIELSAIWALFRLALARQIRARRILILAALFALPAALAALARRYADGFDARESETVLVLGLFPQALIPLAALLGASGMIRDEVEGQTLTYLLIRPLPRWSIYLAKLAATSAVTAALAAVFATATLLAIHAGSADFDAGAVLVRAGKASALMALTIVAYGAVFGALSLFVKRTLALGVAYIILFEGLLANVDFAVRKLTVIYYFRTLCARWLDRSPLDWEIDLSTAPGIARCLATLLIASGAITAVAAIAFARREFRVKTPEGD